MWCLTGKKETEVKELDKVMYHDWRLIPKHMEHQFTDFVPLPEPPVRHVVYPPLLRAMILARHKKAFGAQMAQEPMLPLHREEQFNKDYFRQQEQERRGTQGTAVWRRRGLQITVKSGHINIPPTEEMFLGSLIFFRPVM